MTVKKALFLMLILLCVGVFIYFCVQYFHTSKQVYEGILVYREGLKGQVCYQI